MITYAPTWTGKTHAVVRMGPTGSTLEMECPTFESAAHEAAILNYQHMASQAMPKPVTAYYGQRRSVRYFEPDAFA